MMPNPQTKDSLAPDERGFGALIERVANMTQALDRMAAETSAMRRVVESITTDQVRMQAEIKLLTSQLERAERDLNKKIDDNSLRKAWANLTSIVAGLASLLALLIAMGVIKGAP